MIKDSDFLILHDKISQDFAEKIAGELENRKLGYNFELGKINNTAHDDGESFVQIKKNVRNKSVFLVKRLQHPINTIRNFEKYENNFKLENQNNLKKMIAQIAYDSKTPNDSLIELLSMEDALVRSDVGEFTLILPDFPYGRSDKKQDGRTAIMGKMASTLIEFVGGNKLERILTQDLHASQIEAFFEKPCNNLRSMSAFVWALKNHFLKDLYLQNTHKENIEVGILDVGSYKVATSFAKYLDLNYNEIFKQRDKHTTEGGEAKAIERELEISDKIITLWDDIFGSGGTFETGGNQIYKNKAKKIIACFSHYIANPKYKDTSIKDFATDKLKRLRKNITTDIIITDSLNIDKDYLKKNRISQISLAPIYAEAIHQIKKEYGSLSRLYEPNYFDSIFKKSYENPDLFIDNS